MTTPGHRRCLPFARVALALLLALTACTPGRDLPPLAAYDGRVYRLGVGDQVRVITYGADQLSDAFLVDDAGDIDLPLLGALHAAGLTTHELADRIAARLKQQDVLRDPSVSAEVIAYRPIFILGEVAQPGQYPYLPGMSVLSAIAVAGGYTYRAATPYVRVVRAAGRTTQTGRATPQDYVAPGDVVTIFERRY